METELFLQLFYVSKSNKKNKKLGFFFKLLFLSFSLFFLRETLQENSPPFIGYWLTPPHRPQPPPRGFSFPD